MKRRRADYYSNKPKKAEIKAHLDMLATMGKVHCINGKYRVSDKIILKDDIKIMKR